MQSASTPTAVMSVNHQPPRRWASHTAPATEAALTTPMATGTAQSPGTWVGTARSQNSSGPALYVGGPPSEASEN